MHTAPLLTWLLPSTLMLVAPIAPAAEAAIPACQAQASPPAKFVERYVAVNSAALRAQPAQSAALVAYVPIAKKLSIACEQEGWYAVESIRRQEGKGWMRADLVASEAPTLASLQAQYRTLKASDLAGRRQIAERAVALQPYSVVAYHMLIEVLEPNSPALAAAKTKLAWLQQPTGETRTGEPKIIFVNGTTFTPLARLVNGKLEKYPQGMFQSDQASKILQSYLVTGRSLHVYGNGGHTGVLVVKQGGYQGCDPDPEDMQFLPNHSGVEQNTIVTNFPLTTAAPIAERQVTDSEKKAMLKLARDALLEKKVPAKTVAMLFNFSDEYMRDSVKIDAAQPKGEKLPILILNMGTVLKLPVSKQSSSGLRQYRLRLIAEVDSAGNYRTTYSDYQSKEWETDFEYLHYVTHLDLTGDGVDEFIFSGEGWEWWWHEVLGKVNGKWKILLRGAEAACS